MAKCLATKNVWGMRLRYFCVDSSDSWHHIISAGSLSNCETDDQRRCCVHHYFVDNEFDMWAGELYDNERRSTKA